MALVKTPVAIKVYRITNKVNGRIYVGQTVQPLAARWQQHIRKNDERPIVRAIKKYGQASFTIAVVGIYCCQKDADAAEIYYIDFLNALAPTGYNVSEGGSTRPSGWKHTAAAKLKISETGKGRKRPAVSLETRQKMSAAKKGKPSWNKGKPMTAIWIERLSAARKGRPSPMKGKKWTAKERAFISERTRLGMRKAGYGSQ